MQMRKRPEDVTRLLIGKEEPRFGAHFAHLIPRKGVSHSSHGVDYMKADMRRLGCKRIILKCDKERSLVKTVKESECWV